jgi:hypothetical protein
MTSASEKLEREEQNLGEEDGLEKPGESHSTGAWKRSTANAKWVVAGPGGSESDCRPVAMTVDPLCRQPPAAPTSPSQVGRGRIKRGLEA